MYVSADLDRECGLHSGIPECCVAFFVEVWWPLVLQSNAKSAAVIRARVALMKKTETELGVAFRHTPCAACLAAGRAVTVKKCPPDCRKNAMLARLGDPPPYGRGKGRRKL
jgi:hypothetical protein